MAIVLKRFGDTLKRLVFEKVADTPGSIAHQEVFWLMLTNRVIVQTRRKTREHKWIEFPKKIYGTYSSANAKDYADQLIKYHTDKGYTLISQS